METITIVIAIVLIIAVAILVYAMLNPYMQDRRKTKNPTVRKKPIILDPRFGTGEIISREDMGADKFFLKINTGGQIRDIPYYKGDIKPYVTEQTLCDTSAPLYIYQGGKANGKETNQNQIRIGENMDGAIQRRFSRLTAENKRLKANIQRGIRQHIELTKETNPNRYQDRTS